MLKNRTYVPATGSVANRTFDLRGARLGVLACSESFSPFRYKQLSDAGADILINIASHSWTRGDSHVLFRETTAMARIHAVYTGKPYVQVTNYGTSFILFPNF